MMSSRRPDAIHRAAVVFETPYTSAAARTEPPGTAIVAGLLRGRPSRFPCALAARLRVNFMLRSIVTTYATMSLFLVCGLLSGYRTRSIRVSSAAGLVMDMISAPIKTLGALVLLAIWHDPQTRWAIDRSGGLAEVFQLPLFLLLPGALLASMARREPRWPSRRKSEPVKKLVHGS
jgi:hypothetical protein